jgi:hypothetical protein
MTVMADKPDAAELLRQYGISPPVTDERFARHADLAKGIPFTIDAAEDPYFGQSIRLTIGHRRSSAPCPMSQDEAERLVDEFRLAHLLPDVFHEDMTLVHLLLKCSRLSVESGVTGLHLDCHLSTRGYRVNEVRISTEGRLDIVPRLEPHAHDRKAVFPWRRTARIPNHN